MHTNTIELKDFILDIPKINERQYLLLRHIFISIEKNINFNKSYFITSSIFKNTSFDAITHLLKTNIKLSITDKNTNTWYGSDLINDIKIKEDKIFFRPASILHEIVLNSKQSSLHAYLKYILFNGIRYKPSLLFIDFMTKQESNHFTIDIEELKKILELKPTQYKNFNAFNASVISRIVEDINTKTNYHISYETITKKNGKKIVSLAFDYYNQELNNA